MVKELLCKLNLRVFALGHHQQSRCIHIYSVHQHPHPLICLAPIESAPLRHLLRSCAVRYAPEALLHRPCPQVKVICKRINERTGKVSVPRVNHQSGRLVYHKKRIIFVNNIQRNILRLYLRFVASVGEGNRKYIQRLNLVVGLYNLPVGHYISGIYGKLNAIPGGALHM